MWTAAGCVLLAVLVLMIHHAWVSGSNNEGEF